MKVLFQNRESAFLAVGGDTIQMLKTKEYLEKLGVQIEISLEKTPNLNGYDLVHIFNIQDCAARYSYEQIINAKKKNVPVVLSPIYWYWDDAEVYGNQNIGQQKSSKKRVDNAFGYINNFLGGCFGFKIKDLRSIEKEIRCRTNNAIVKQSQLDGLLLVDVILPNAYEELHLIEKIIETKIRNFFIVPNAVDLNFSMNDHAGKIFKKFGVKEYILCVARIEMIKNQLSLINALKGIDIPFLLVGKKTDIPYYEFCAKNSGNNVKFIDEMAHEDLVDLYIAAKVHVLPSWRETPGLVNLEAGLCGCNLVVTDRGTTREYFKDFVWYCDPADKSSIRKAVLEAYNAPKSDGLREHIKNNFTWDKAAEVTLQGYKKALENK